MNPASLLNFFHEIQISQVYSLVSQDFLNLTSSEQATREIMWNIPKSFKVLMYFGFILSLVILAAGIYKKYLFIIKGKGKNSLISPHKNWFQYLKNLQWKNFFQTIFFQGKVPRRRYVGIFHSFIYYGFIILWIATDLVAIHYDTPFKIFQGPLYIVISFLADFAGVFILIGLALAYYRRYVVKPKHLEASKPGQELYMYLMLANLVIVGFLLEGLRLLGTNEVTGAMAREQFWAPFGFLVALGFQKMNLTDLSLSYLYRSLWFFHMVSTMVFIGSLGWSKFSHILLAPFSALITPRKRGGVLKPMNFEDENVETFGLSKVAELTAKQRYDTQVCVECGRCTEVCPANLAQKPLNPKTIITKMRDLINLEETHANPVSELDTNPLTPYLKPIELLEEKLIWDENHPLYFSNELDSCTTCGACMEECPVNIEHVQIIMDLKRYKVLTLGDVPSAGADAINKIKVHGNPWGIGQSERFNWAQNLATPIPVIEASKKVDYLYYVGCAGSYDPSNQKVVKDTLQLLQHGGVSFAVLGKSEKCNGDPVRRMGDEFSFNEIAIDNIANLRKYQFDTIVTHCPHCLHTIGKEYAKFEEGEFHVIHHTELLNQLIKTNKITPQKTLEEKRTFHDPCYLGRHHGQYEDPRDILKAIEGITLVEMERSKDKALCCGMGGGNMWYELPEGEHLVNNRLHDIAETKSQKLSTGCSFCMINFNGGKGHHNETQDMEVEDIASTLHRSVF
jgi:Fe-S oxidoreductase